MDNNDGYVDMMSLNEAKFAHTRTSQSQNYGDEIDERTAQWIREQISGTDKQERKLVPILQTVSTMHGNVIRLDEDALKSIFLRPEVANYPIMLLSVSGAFRKGKSFLLNFLLRYLRENGHKNPNWLGKTDQPMCDGFEWRGGKNPMTQGILVYNEPFLIKVNDKKVVVLLMDTQGLFDNNSDKKLCTQIFAFSTLLSSVQVFNLSQQIQENDLEYLQCFTEYAKASQAKKVTDKPIFQKLMFVVRDWQGIDDHDWGLDNAEDKDSYLAGVLSCTSNNKELTYVREHLHKSFNQLQCFLLPHPGMKVAVTRKNYQFTGELKDIDDEFLEMVQELADILLSPKSIVPKSINGQVITGISLVNYAISCARSFADGRLPEPQTMLQTQEEVMNLQVLRICLDEYVSQMRKLCTGGYIPDDDLSAIHDRIGRAQLEAFRSKVGQFNSEATEVVEANLMDSMLEKFEIFQRNNYAKGREISRSVREAANQFVHEYVWKMEENTKDQALEQHAFERCHQLTQNSILSAYDGKCKGRNGYAEGLEALRKDIEFSFNVLTRMNMDRRNLQQLKTKDDSVKIRNLVHDCVEQYKKDMKKFSRKYADISTLVNEHGKVRSQIFKQFEQKSKSVTNSLAVEHSAKLSDRLQDEFCEVEATNDSNRKMLSLILQQKRNKLIVQYRVIMSKGMKETYVKPEVLHEAHNQTEQSLVDRVIHDDDVESICVTPIIDPFVRKCAEDLRNELGVLYQSLLAKNEENRKLFPQTTGGFKSFFRSIWNSR